MQLIEKSVKLQSFPQTNNQDLRQYRITVPPEIVRRMGWRTGDRLVVQCDEPDGGMLVATHK